MLNVRSGRDLLREYKIPNFPTGPYSFVEPWDQEIGESYEGQERRATDFEAPKLWKGRSG